MPALGDMLKKKWVVSFNLWGGLFLVKQYGGNTNFNKSRTPVADPVSVNP